MGFNEGGAFPGPICYGLGGTDVTATLVDTQKIFMKSITGYVRCDRETNFNMKRQEQL